MPPKNKRHQWPYVFACTPGVLDLENKEIDRLKHGIRSIQLAKRLMEGQKDEPNTNYLQGSVLSRKASADIPSPRKRKLEAVSGSSSSLSPASGLPSPTIEHKMHDLPSARSSPSCSSNSLDSHQPPPAPSITQYPTFGPDPSTFDDPTIYHIREVTDDMTEEEKKEIYCVAQFPHDDLSNLIAGTPPDNDFSNAKPTNQVNANTFAGYIEPYLRPLTEEDMAFLKERVRTFESFPRFRLMTFQGDRTTPFMMPRRGKRHYTEIWAEEDGHISLDGVQQTSEKLPPNQARGNLEQMDDETAETDQISAGPMLNRLLSTMRFEHRPSPTEDRPNGLVNGISEASVNGISNGESITTGPPIDEKVSSLPSATFMPESTSQTWKTPSTKLDHLQIDERLKAELRYIGLLSPDAEPDYDAHYDDEVAERLRVLQAELKRVSVVNGARKARILELANERMAYQEYSTILEDLDSQVQQAYLKRTRTLGKGKKNAKRPGGGGGGGHSSAGGAANSGIAGAGSMSGVTKPGIGDMAKQLMERRKKWEGKIGPIFGADVTRVRGSGEGIFGDDVMEPLMKAELERWDEEAE